MAVTILLSALFAGSSMARHLLHILTMEPTLSRLPPRCPDDRPDGQGSLPPSWLPCPGFIRIRIPLDAVYVLDGCGRYDHLAHTELVKYVRVGDHDTRIKYVCLLFPFHDTTMIFGPLFHKSCDLFSPLFRLLRKIPTNPPLFASLIPLRNPQNNWNPVHAYLLLDICSHKLHTF
jgi:hypothetical protein